MGSSIMRAHVIKDGVIVNTIEVESLSFMPGLVDASIGSEKSDLWDGFVFSKTVVPLNEAILAKKDEVSAYAKTIETSGVIVGGITIGTAREDQARVTGAVKLMERRSTESIDIETKSGPWIKAGLTTLQAIEDATWDHLKATAANCKAHHDAIDLLTTTQAVNDYDFSTGW